MASYRPSFPWGGRLGRAGVIKFWEPHENYIQGQENMYSDLRTLAIYITNNLNNEDLGVHVRRSFITAIFLYYLLTF